MISVLYHLIVIYLERGWESRYFAFSAASLPFATGALLYWYSPLIKSYYQRLQPRIHKFVPAFLYLLLALNWYVAMQLGTAKTAGFYINYIICALMVAILSSSTEHIAISKSLDSFLGRLSYPIYLIHYQVGFVVLIFAGTFGVTVSRNQFLLFVLALPFVIAASWLMARYIEDPIDQVRAKVKKRKAHPETDKVKLSQKS